MAKKENTIEISFEKLGKANMKSYCKIIGKILEIGIADGSGNCQ